MKKTKHDIIIEGLDGRIIDDYLEGWTFRLREVSSNFFRVDGTDSSGRKALGFGTDSEKAFDDCVKEAERITNFQNMVSQIKSRILKLLRFGK